MLFSFIANSNIKNIPEMKKIILLVGFCCLLLACRKETTSEIPNVPVYREIYLNTIETIPLLQDGGAIQVAGGYRGIIVYRENAVSYRAYEATCSFEPTNPCAKVQIDTASRIFMTCYCCGSRFNFQSGTPLNSPATRPLRPYFTELRNNLLIVSN
jgi:nitrite reductase/ring-hydroxylating ferredoxin subunit